MSLPPLDHNAPPRPVPLTEEQIKDWLGYEYAGLIERRTEVLQSLTNVANALLTHPIQDDAGQGRVGDARRTGESLVRLIETRRGEAKRPFLEAGKTVDTWAKDLADSLRTGLKPLISEMDRYGIEKEERERKEREENARLARIEADRQAAEAARALQEEEAVRQADALQAASRAEGKADRAERRAEKGTADLTRVHSDFGTTSSLVEEMDVTVTDKAALPLDLLVPDMVEIRRRARVAWADDANKPAIRAGRQPIPGATITITKTTRVRGS